jgi:hypothetical protein
VNAFIDRLAAPAGVRAAVAFTHALAVWDWPAASSAADSLLQPALDGRSWIPVDDLRDGAVVAKLRMGDAPGARRYFDALARRSERGASDFRVRLLDAYLRAAVGN